MFKFLIKKLSDQWIATLNSSWDEVAQVSFDNDNAVLIEDFISRNGMSVEGYAVSLPRMRPSEFHYTFISNYAAEEGFTLEVIEGEIEPYNIAQNESTSLANLQIEPLKPFETDESIFDAEEDEEDQLKMKEQSFTLQDKYQFQGLPISIENKAGSKREGIDPDGHKWSVPMHFDYGYIRSTNGADNEGIDVYVGKNRKAEHVYIVKQHKIEAVKKWRSSSCPKCKEFVHDCACNEFFDEDKVMLGFDNKEQAKSAYLKQYDNELFLGPISTMTISNFKKAILAAKGKKLTLPLRFVHDSVFDAEQEDIDAILAAKNIDELENIFYSIFQETNENVTFGLKQGGVKTRERINNEVKAIVAKVEALGGDASSLTEDELDLLRQYSGRGGLTENSQFEYFTPTYIAEGCWDLLGANGFSNGNVLEPSAGAGVFNATKKQGVFMTATEIDPVSSGVNRILHPEDNIFTQSFEKLAVEAPDDHFDSVIGNVPFGIARGASAHDDPDHKNEKLIERYFINRLIDKVKPGGLIVLVTPVNIVREKSKAWQTWRAKISKKAEFLGAHKLPSKTFGKQGTQVVTDIVVFKKHSKEAHEKIIELPIDQLKETKVVWDTFITGKWWEKDGKPFIHGKFVPKDATKIRDDDKVIRDSALTDAALKKKLAVKFHSRIDWAALDTIEPVIRNYVEGDRRVIDEKTYEFINGAWQPYINQAQEKTGINSNTFGAASVQELKYLLESNEGALNLSFTQAKACYDSFKELLSDTQRKAIEFALHQPKEKYREQIYRGSLIGADLARLQSSIDNNNWDAMEQERLQNLVESEIAKYGHPKKNQGLLLAGDKSRYFGIFSSAIDENGNLSTLLTGERAISSAGLSFDNTNLNAIVEHLYVREGILNITLEDLQGIYKGSPAINSLSDIAENQLLAIDTDGHIMPMARFCSGDVYAKMISLSVALKNETDHKLKAKYQQQLEEIDKRRTKTPTSEIGFSLRHKWISKKYILEFLHERNYKPIKYQIKKEIERTDPDTGKKWKEKTWEDDLSSSFGTFRGYESGGSGFEGQLIQWLNGGNITTQKENKERHLALIENLERDFSIWIQQHEDADKLTDTYNQKFNSYIPFEHSREDLNLEGVSPMVKPHWYQNQGVRRLSEDGSGILGFDVGLGKTFSALALAAYNKQMGRADKTLIVVPKAVLANWYHEAKLFYGNLDHALFVGFAPKRDKKTGDIEQEPVLDEFGQQKRNKHTNQLEFQDVIKAENSKVIFEKMHEIPNTNKSLVIMTHERFKAIPMRAATKHEYANKWIDKSLMSDAAAFNAVSGQSVADARKNGDLSSLEGERKFSYQDAVRKGQLEQRFLDDGGHKKDEYPFFEDMGFKSVIVDEAHGFKNSFKGGEKTGSVKLIANPTESQKAVDMAMKMSWLRDNNSGRGPIMLTATPVTNSPLEIFNMLSLVMPVEEFEKYGIYTVDDFVRVFGLIESKMQLKIDGQPDMVEMLTGFRNLQGLRNIFNRYSLIMNADHVNNKSQEEGETPPFKLPEVVDVDVEVDMTESQGIAYELIRKEIKAKIKQMQGQEGRALGLFPLMRDMDKVTTDMDLYQNEMTFIFPSSIEREVELLIASMPAEIDAERDETPDEMGNTTEDLGGKKKKVKYKLAFDYSLTKQGDSLIFVVPAAYEKWVVDLAPQQGIKQTDISHKLSPKYAALIGNLRKEHEMKGKQLIFTEEKTQHHKIKRMIVTNLQDILTPDQIGIINADEAKDEKLQQLSDLFNSGDILVMICNKKAEMGVNLNKGVVTAVHNLTFPWTPASMQQRSGRAVRQGNNASEVRIYNYIAKKSFDNYRLELLNGKKNWINQLLTGTDNSSENAGGYREEDYYDAMADNPEEAKAARLATLAKIEAEKIKAIHTLCAIDLSQLISITQQLSTFEQNKIAALDTLMQNRDKAQATLNRKKENGEDVGTSEIALNNILLKIRDFDEDWDNKKKRLESNLKQRKGSLQQRKQLNQLPFDASLIDNPDNAIVAKTGQVFVVGNTFETKKGAILKIESINRKKNEITYSEVFKSPSYEWTGVYNRDDNGFVTYTCVLTNIPENLTQVSVSQEELEEKIVLAKKYNYSDLSELDKETFLKYRDRLWLYSGRFLYRNENGEFSLQDNSGDRNLLVYPDTEGTELKSALAKFYLKQIRANIPSARLGWSSVMEVFWGYDWQVAIEVYGDSANQSDILELCGKSWEQERTTLLEQISTSQYHKDKDLDIAMYDAWKTNKYRFERDIGEKAQSLGDNINTIQVWVEEYFDAQEDQLKQLAIKAEERIKNEALAKIKEDPRYKELPDNILSAFKNIGITVKYNYINVEIPQNGKFRGYTIPSFSALFLQDENGRRGKLILAKETLKSRHGAKYCVGDGDFSGSWWYFDSNVDVEKVYEIIADA